MAVTLTWLVLAATALVMEVRSRRTSNRMESLGTIASRFWARVPGRIVLVLVWAFVGWHLFARYTVPR